MNNPVKNIDPDGMDVWSTTDPGEIRRAMESLLRGRSFRYNDNWTHTTDNEFLNLRGSYSAGLNYNSRTGQLWLLSGGGIGEAFVSQLTWVPGKGFIQYSEGGYGYENSIGGGWLTPAGRTVDGIGGFGTGMTNLDGSFRLIKGGQFSPKYYESNWGGGSRARITTYSAAQWGAKISRGSVVVSAGLHAYSINQANIQDGRTFGYNTQATTAQAAGNLLGSWGGAEAGAAIGAAIGVWFGGAGAVPGAIIGGVAGGILGGWGGSELGSSVFDWYWYY